ncbi:copper resistance protein CopC [Streptosporangium sp. LJ11]|uniref:copper resistance CopC family protein n=1 Tax=Streptosporangium sp. LJ11 TaxID=3436927 RepID=UPI003F78C9A9
MKTSPVAVALALLVALVLGTAFASPALAHDRLKSSDPAKGAKVENLEEVKLTFSATVRFPNVIVRSGDENHQDGKAVADGSVVTQKVKGDLPPGEYVIAYRVTSSDGHPIEGEIPFTLLGSAGPSPSPSSPSSETLSSPDPAESTATGGGPAASTPAATLGPAAAGESEDAGSSGGVPGWMWIVVGGLTGIGIGLFFSMRGRKQP